MISYKPLESINKVSSLLRSGRRLRVASKNDSIILDSVVMILVSGIASIRREDGISLMDISGPMVLGFSEVMALSEDYYFCFHSNAKFFTLPRKSALDICARNNAWLDVCNILSYFVSLLCESAAFSEKKTKYETVRKYLENISSMPEEERESISIYKYIMSRCSVSRSSLNKILTGLRSGGYIDIYRGRLLKVHRLPDRF